MKPGSNSNTIKPPTTKEIQAKIDKLKPMYKQMLIDFSFTNVAWNALWDERRGDVKQMPDIKTIAGEWVADQRKLFKQQDRLEQERLEQERLEQERLEQKRLEQKRLEQERLKQERLEQEQLEQRQLQATVAKKFKELRSIYSNYSIHYNISSDLWGRFWGWGNITDEDGFDERVELWDELILNIREFGKVQALEAVEEAKKTILGKECGGKIGKSTQTPTPLTPGAKPDYYQGPELSTILQSIQSVQNILGSSASTVLCNLENPFLVSLYRTLNYNTNALRLLAQQLAQVEIIAPVEDVPIMLPFDMLPDKVTPDKLAPVEAYKQGKFVSRRKKRASELSMLNSVGGSDWIEGGGPKGGDPTGNGPNGSGPNGSGPKGGSPKGGDLKGGGPKGGGSSGSGQSGSGPNGSGPNGSGPKGGGPKGGDLKGGGSTGSGPNDSGPNGSGPTGNGPKGGGPTGSGPNSSGPAGNGPKGGGPKGGGPNGSGPSGSGQSGSGPSGPNGSGPKGGGPKERDLKGVGPKGGGPTGSGQNGSGPSGPNDSGPNDIGPKANGSGPSGSGTSGVVGGLNGGGQMDQLSVARFAMQILRVICSKSEDASTDNLSHI